MDRIIRLVNYGEHTIIRVKQKQEKRKSRLVEKKKWKKRGRSYPISLRSRFPSSTSSDEVRKRKKLKKKHIKVDDVQKRSHSVGICP